MGGDHSAQHSQQSAADQSAAESKQTYDTVSPGLSTAEAYYKKLSSGDPNAIFSAVSPAVNGIIGNTEHTKQNILANAPRGGESTLAIENADISKTAQVGNLETSAYTSSFPALASLASSGMGVSVNEMANAVSGFGSVMQAQSADKASTMGLMGSLAGAAGTAYACWIAAVVFGEDLFTGPRVILVRHWLVNHYAKTTLGMFVVAAYRRYGQRVARAIQPHPWLQTPFRALFQVALRGAQARYER